MVFNSGEETNTSNSFKPLESYVMTSKSCDQTKKPNQSVFSKIPKSSSSKKSTRIRSKTCNEIILKDENKPINDKTGSASAIENAELGKRNNKSETCLTKNVNEIGDENKKTMNKAKEEQESSEAKKALSKEPSEIFFDVSEEVCVAIKTEKTEKSTKKNNPPPKKKPSEIPKLKTIVKTSLKSTPKTGATSSKLPVKTTKKEPEQINKEPSTEGPKNKPDSERTLAKPPKGKKNEKEKKLKDALKEDFCHLVPLYENRLKKITDVWTNTIYCSLTMRTNLIQFLFNVYPYIDRSQFYMEDEKLNHCIDHTKTYTNTEVDNLIRFVKSLVANREKGKEEYSLMISNREIAESYNYDWKSLSRKITELGEETKHLQMETPEIQKKKEDLKVTGNEKLQKMELDINQKNEKIKNLMSQLNILKHRESSYKGNVFLKLKDYKDIKADVVSLISVQKEFEELKANYMYQNDMYEKKIKALETLLEEKKRDLENTKEVKKQLQGFLVQLQEQQKRLTTKIGREPLDYVMGKSSQGRNKRREQLWMTAINLVLKGFLVQMKKLERDRNKMLLELQSDDPENLNALVSAIIQKNNFIKSLNHQMNAYYKASKCPQLSQDSSKKEN